MVTLWMGDLEAYMDEFFIMQAFEQMGEPATQVKLIQNKYTGLPAGYCFVDFHDTDAAQRAMLRLNGKIIPNSQPPHRFKLNSSGYAKENFKRKEFSLFVGELTDEVDDYILYTAFSKKYPSCHTAKVVIDNTGRSKGYGFVRFSDEGDQQKALIEMQHVMGIGRKPIRVSLATPKRQKTDTDSSSYHSYGNQGYYGGGGYYNSYQDYMNYYQSYYANQYPAGSVNQHPYVKPSEDPDVLEDPELEIDVAQYNEYYMNQSEEIFTILEESRWNLEDQWDDKTSQPTR